MIRCAFKYIAFSVAISLVLCSTVSGNLLSGYAEMGYANYTIDSDGQRVAENSHFYQKYSLMANKVGLFKGGRAGSYRLALGAEWAAVNSDIDSIYSQESTNSDEFKVLYNGELNFAPGGLPFRLRMFTYDNSSPEFEESFNRYRLTSGATILNPRLLTDVRSVDHRVTGLTLYAGIQNGSYRGQYRDILARYPRVLIDYKERTVKDNRSRVDFVERNLAFVSLNKKDNWFHYRVYDYKDNIASYADFRESTFLLGTIDHMLNRKWVNLTNWVAFSADGSYTRREYNNQKRPEERDAAVNFFSTAKRGNLSITNLSSFRRERLVKRSLRKKLHLPFYASGKINVENSWRATLVGSLNDEQYDNSELDNFNDDYVFARVQFDLLQRSRYILRPEASAELRRASRGDGYGFNVGLEAISNSAYNAKNQYYGSMHLSVLQGEGSTAEDVDYVETRFRGNVQRLINPKLTVGLDQTMTVGYGSLDSSVSPLIPVTSTQGFASRDSLFLRAQTVLSAELRSGRLRNSVEATYVYQRLDSKDDDSGLDEPATHSFFAEHRLTYNGRKIRANQTNRFSVGDAAEYGPLGSQILSVSVSQSTLDDVDWSFYSFGDIDFTSSKTLENGSSYRFSTSDDGSYQFQGEYTLGYHFFDSRGLVRKVASLYGTLSYENYHGFGNDPQIAALELEGTWNPYRYMTLGGSVTYKHLINDDNDFGQVVSQFYADFGFPKFTLNMSYDYAVRGANSVLEKQTEQLWQVNLKKFI